MRLSFLGADQVGKPSPSAKSQNWGCDRPFQWSSIGKSENEESYRPLCQKIKEGILYKTSVRHKSYGQDTPRRLQSLAVYTTLIYMIP